MASAATPALDIPVPMEDAVNSPVVVAVPTKGVCGSEVKWLRRAGAEVELDELSVDEVDDVASCCWPPPLWCFFGSAPAKGNEPKLNRKAPLMSMIMWLSSFFECTSFDGFGSSCAEILVLSKTPRMLTDIP